MNVEDTAERDPNVGVQRLPLRRGLETLARLRYRLGIVPIAQDDAIVGGSLPVLLSLRPRQFGLEDRPFYQRSRASGEFLLGGGGLRVFENRSERLRPDPCARMRVVDMERRARGIRARIDLGRDDIVGAGFSPGCDRVGADLRRAARRDSGGILIRTGRRDFPLRQRDRRREE